MVSGEVFEKRYEKGRREERKRKERRRKEKRGEERRREKRREERRREKREERRERGGMKREKCTLNQIPHFHRAIFANGEN